MENSGDRKRQGPAVVHCAGLSRAPCREVIGTGAQVGPWRLGEHRRHKASLWRPLSGPRLLQGLPIAHSVRAPLPSLPCRSALPPLAPHLTWIFSFEVEVFDSRPCPEDASGSLQAQSSLSLSCPVF